MAEGVREQVETVEETLRVGDGPLGIADFGLRIDAGDPSERKRVVYVFNKADLLPEPDAFLARVRERYPHAVLTSANPPSAIRIPNSAIERPRTTASACARRDSPGPVSTTTLT